jgi:hypothetical protein
MTDDHEQLTNDTEQLLALLQSIGGAVSITMSLLSIYERPIEPPGLHRNDRNDLLQLTSLCVDLGRETSGIARLSALLELKDTFVSQGRQAYPSQIATARALNREFCNWMFATFPEALRRAEV